MQNLGQRAERNALIEHALQFHVAARKRVADDDEIGTGIEVGFGKRLRYRDAQRFEKRRHRRIGRRIRAGDAEAALLQHAGEGSHRRPADADQMNVFGFSHWRSHIGGLLYLTVDASRIRSSTASSTVSRARTPIGSVMFARETCPERSPNATGIRKSSTIRRITSSSV